MLLVPVRSEFSVPDPITPAERSNKFSHREEGSIDP